MSEGTAEDTNLVQSHVKLILAELPANVVSTLKAVKSFTKLQKALLAFFQSGRTTNDQQTFEKKVRTILLDGGMAKTATIELITRWKNRKIVPIKEAEPKKSKKKVEIIKKEENTPSTSQENGGDSKEGSIDASKEGKTKIKVRERKHLATQAAANAKISNWVEDVHSSQLEADMAALAIRATSQESRFYTEYTTTATKEIDLKDVNLFVGEKQLLNDAHLRIKEGVKYGLVGKNGAGKSTLLRALGDGLIPGLPSNVKILLVSQLGIEESLRILAASESRTLNVLDAALQGDKQRVQAEREVDILSKAIDAQDSKGLQAIVKQLWRDRSFAELEEARRISLRRSGAIGKQARTALIEAEKRYEEAKANFPQHGNEDDWEQHASKLHAKAMTVLEETDAATVVPRAHAILRGLGFTDEMIQKPYSNLSGGWRSRCSLASALLLSNHVLLLDEPINFLDLPSILWLEQFVRKSEETVITVAHDVEFLNMVSDELIVVRKNKLEYFDGNLAEYMRTKRRQHKHAVKQQDALDKKKDLIEKSIQEGRKQAKKSGDENRMRMVKSRQKKLEDRWGLERNAAGHRFKLNRDLGGYYLTSRAGIEIEEQGPPVHYEFPDPDPLPFAASLLHLENLTFQHQTAKQPLLKNVNITIDIGDRIGLVGPNGHGKTTLLQLIMSERQPTSGNIQKHSRMRIAYYAQQAMADIDFQTSKQTALEHFLEHCSAQELLNENRARGFLAQFDLKGRTVDALPIGKLSGGQRVKLLLAEVVCVGPHILILDEVTTHMDSDSIRALIGALKRFKGAVILISHDRHAIKEVIEGRPTEEMEGSGSEDESSEEEEEDEELGSLNPSGTAPQRKTFLVRNGSVKVLEKGVEEYVSTVEQTMQASFSTHND